MTSFQSSLPKGISMRGIRVRHGNIEVGNERFLDHIFTEPRFATWHIGEIHLNHNIKPNARRDGFEEGDDYERFLERIAVIGKGLSSLCRSSSTERSVKQRVITELSHVESLTKASQLAIDRQHHEAVVQDSKERLERVAHLATKHELDAVSKRKAKQLGRVVEKLASMSSYLVDQIDGRKVSKIPQRALLQRFCRHIVDAHEKDQPIERTLQKALRPFLRK